MLENLTLVVVVIVVLWLGAFGYYLYTSRQQNSIADDLERLQKKLDEVEKH
jgi:predicted negative regulator of RcsB-dependent stress response